MVEMGVVPVAAHLCVLYYGVLSNIIPPVAFAAFAGAGVAGSNPMSTGITATKFGAAGLFVPFLFVYHPELVLEGPWFSTILALITSTIAVICLASSLQGWFLTRISLAKRALLFVIFAIFVFPNPSVKLLGFALLACQLFLLERKALISKFRRSPL